MSTVQPYIVTMLNKARINPLQAASDHCGRKMHTLNSGGEGLASMGVTIYEPTRRDAVVAHSELVAPAKGGAHYEHLPESLRLPRGAKDVAIQGARNVLWMLVDMRETREDAQFCRKFELALPSEIELARAREALGKFAEQELASEGIVVDLAIHETRQPDGAGGHRVTSRWGSLLCTTRTFEDEQFAKKNREWNQPAYFYKWRSAWFRILAEVLPQPEQSGSETKRLRAFTDRILANNPGKKLPWAPEAVRDGAGPEPAAPEPAGEPDEPPPAAPPRRAMRL